MISSRRGRGLFAATAVSAATVLVVTAAAWLITSPVRAPEQATDLKLAGAVAAAHRAG